MADDDSRNYVEAFHEAQIMGFSITTLKNILSDNGGIQLKYPMKLNDYSFHYLNVPSNELTPAEDKIVDKWGNLIGHSTIVSLTETVTLGNQTFKDVIVVEIATHTGKFY